MEKKEMIKVVDSHVTIRCADRETANYIRAKNLKDPLGNSYDVVVVPEATTILSKAIEQVEQMGDWKVMVAMANSEDYHDGKPKEECLYTFCDIESKELRGVIYKEIEREM